jgi:hypothetical protein
MDRRRSGDHARLGLSKDHRLAGQGGGKKEIPGIVQRMRIMEFAVGMAGPAKLPVSKSRGNCAPAQVNGAVQKELSGFSRR